MIVPNVSKLDDNKTQTKFPFELLDWLSPSGTIFPLVLKKNTSC